MYSKPSWLTPEEFRKFLEMYGNYPTCQKLTDKCLSNGGVINQDDFTVDHITPRSANGTNDLSNLQPLCRVCNSYKNSNDDQYWSRTFYFDRYPNLDKYLTSQKQFAYDLITQDYREWFNRPWSQINQILYVLAWFTGAGKTHTVTAIPFALNWIKNTQQSNDVRVARVLVLVKEEAIRDQLKEELETETIKYGICDVSPRVLAMEGRSWTISTYENYDIVVACIQQLWQTDKSGEPVKDLSRILGEFQVIFFDEIHYAYNRVQLILQNAYKSLCFGLTATPMDAAGTLVNSCAVLSTYTWEDGNQYDANMKDIPTDINILVEEVGFEDWRGYRYGENIRDTDEAQGHQYQIETAKRVANSVVAYVKDLDCEVDRINRGDYYPSLASHRVDSQYSFLPDLTYSAHALIKVDSIETAYIIKDALNQQFDNDRNTYPKEQGYIADVVHSGRNNGYETNRAAQPLTDDHPWLRLKNKGKIGARFLVAVEIGREGVNNPYCIVTGLACPVNSLVDIIQRPIGRSVRAVKKEDKARHLIQVPPARLDTIKIITHKVYSNIGIIQRALDYVRNMEDRLASLPTVDDLMNGASVYAVQDDTEKDALDEFTKIKIIDYLGRHWLKDEKISPDDLFQAFTSGDDSPKRQQRIKEWSGLAVTCAPPVKNFILTDSSLAPVDLVTHETPKVIIPDDQLIDFIKRHEPEIADVAGLIPVDSNVRKVCLQMRRRWIEKFYAAPLCPKEGESLSRIRRYLAGRVIDLLGESLTSPKEIVFGIVGNAMKDILGIPHDVKLLDKSRYDIPQAHSLLRRPNISRRIVRYTISELVKKGYCPSLSEVVGNE